MRYEFEHEEITRCGGCPFVHIDHDWDSFYCNLHQDGCGVDEQMKIKKFFKTCPLKKVEGKNE